MISIFRNLRQTLLSTGKTGKYLKYALGEIVLVMIGILLALQVNNWHEQRKVSKTVESLFTVFENKLADNIRECNSLIGRGYYRDSITTRYVNNEATREDLRGILYFFFEFGTSTRDLVADNLDALIELEKELPQKYAVLVPDLKQLKARIESQRIWEKAVIEIGMARKKEMADQLPTYYLKDSLSIKKHKLLFVGLNF